MTRRDNESDEEIPSTPRNANNNDDNTTTNNAAEKALLSFLLGGTPSNNNSNNNNSDNNKNNKGTPSTAERTPLLEERQDDDNDDANLNDNSFSNALGEMDDSDRAFGKVANTSRGLFGFPSSPMERQSQEKLVDQVLETAKKREPRGILPRDVFSLIVTVKPGSNGFWIVMITVFVQIIVLTLISVDSIDLQGDDEYPSNLLQVPATSEMQVTLAQFLALTIASLSQYDVVQAIILYNVGYEPDNIEACVDDAELFHPEYLRSRWFASVALRFAVGFSTIVVTFMLVAQSETVRDVMVSSNWFYVRRISWFVCVCLSHS